MCFNTVMKFTPQRKEDTMSDLELTRPVYGTLTHIRYVGQSQTLCGVQSLGRFTGQHSNEDVVRNTTCRNCKRSWNSLSPQQRRLVLNSR